MTWTKKETELAKALVEDLHARGWEVYQEVECRGSVADIVAVQGAVIWAIETKLTLSLAVLGQAHRWLRLANLVSCAVPPGRSSIGREFAESAASEFGIGLLIINDPSRRADWYRDVGAIERLRPAFRRRVGENLRRALRPEHKFHCAAGSSAGRYTAFSATCDRLRRVLQSGPMTPRQAVAALQGQHHYASEASAIGSLRKWAQLGKIEGVMFERRDGKPTLLLTEAGRTR